MGVESRIYVVDRHQILNDVYAIQIVSMNLEKTNYRFRQLFNEPIDYELYLDGSDEGTDKDLYGDRLTFAPIRIVIGWIEQEIAVGDYERHMGPLLGLLKGFNEKDWVELQVVHYGY